MSDKDQIPWTTIRPDEYNRPSRERAYLVAARRCLRERGEGDLAITMCQEIDRAVKEITERYVHVRGTGAILEGDHDS